VAAAIGLLQAIQIMQVPVLSDIARYGAYMASFPLKKAGIVKKYILSSH
jgi:hypothetical protein